MSDWVRGYFATIDTMNIDEYLKYHTKDVRLRFANAEPVIGNEAVRQSGIDFWKSLKSMHHDLIGVWEQGNTTIVEAEITYTLKGNRVVVLPCTTILRREGDLIKDVRMFMDASPLFA